MTEHTTPRLLRLPDVIRMTGLGKSTIWKRTAEGSFPAKRNIGARTAVWVESEVVAWINAAIA